MLRRLIALAAALLFVAAPVAAAVCEATCAQHAAMSTMRGRHACCPERPGAGATVRSVVVLCDHPGDAPASTTQSQLVATAPPGIAEASSMWLASSRIRAGHILPAAPHPLARTTQLRI